MGALASCPGVLASPVSTCVYICVCVSGMDTRPVGVRRKKHGFLTTVSTLSPRSRRGQSPLVPCGALAWVLRGVGRSRSVRPSGNGSSHRQCVLTGGAAVVIIGITGISLKMCVCLCKNVHECLVCVSLLPPHVYRN